MLISTKHMASASFFWGVQTVLRFGKFAVKLIPVRDENKFRTGRKLKRRDVMGDWVRRYKTERQFVEYQEQPVLSIGKTLAWGLAQHMSEKVFERSAETTQHRQPANCLARRIAEIMLDGSAFPCPAISYAVP